MKNVMYWVLVILQALSAIGQYLIISTIASSMVLRIAYAAGLGLTPAFVFGIALTVSPVSAKATSLLAWTPGGVVSIFGGMLILAALMFEVPVLMANKYSRETALMLVAGTQVPTALVCTFFSYRVLSSLANEERYALWMESTRRTIKLLIQIEMLRVVQTAIEDFKKIASDKRSVQHRGAIMATVNEPELRALNITQAVEELCDRAPVYSADPDTDAELQNKVRAQLETLPVYPKPAKASDEEESWGQPVSYLRS